MADEITIVTPLPIVAQRAGQLVRHAAGLVLSVDLHSWPGVAYGSKSHQRMQIWEPDNLAPRDGWPCVIMLHGGGWREGSPSEFAALGPALAHRGVMVCAPQLGLAPQHRWPDPLADLNAVLDAVKGLQADQERLALWGHSAGGHLALMANDPRVRAMVTVGAPTHLPSLAIPTDMFDDPQGASPGARSQTLPPTLMIHGTRDQVVPISQARQMAQDHPEITLMEVVGADHGLHWPPRATRQARNKALRWLIQQLSPAPRSSKWRIRKKANR